MDHAPGTSLDLQWVTIHGHERAFVKVGQGPPCCCCTGWAAPTARGCRWSSSSHGTSP